MGNNTIKTHLVLHLGKDILDHGFPYNVNSAYAESAHIPLAKVTAKNTQKRSTSFTKQEAHRYIENRVISLANFDVLGDSTKMSKWAAPLIEGEKATSIAFLFSTNGLLMDCLICPFDGAHGFHLLVMVIDNFNVIFTQSLLNCLHPMGMNDTWWHAMSCRVIVDKTEIKFPLR
jgi:hypothetical protein